MSCRFLISKESLVSLSRFPLLILLSMAMFSMGCCGPAGCGIGCGSGCYDCDGTAVAPASYGPLDGWQNFKRSLVCGGGGCGETYVGEWTSTPPDACDPCCGNQFVGGATKCRPFCWTPGSLLGGLNIYGKRFCSGNESSMPCGCGDVGCDGGCGIGESYFDGDVYNGGEIYGGGGVVPAGGCSSCAAARSTGRGRHAGVAQRSDSRTRSAARTEARAERIRR